MSIIAPSIFVAEIAIAQSENAYVDDNIQKFIDKYERKFMLELFGATFYAEILAGLALLDTNPAKAKWISLRDETDLKQMIANYVYYWYKRNETTLSAGISETKPKAQNADVTNSIDKQIRSWNEMVHMVRLFDLSTTVYPNWVRKYWRNYNYNYWWDGCDLAEIYFFKNTLDL